MTAYVQLIVPQKLTQDQFKCWFDCVEQNVPSGLIGATTIQTDGQTRSTKYFTKLTANGKHAYVIPLVRDLDASEVHAVLRSWCEHYPDGDFTFDYSQSEGIEHAQPPSLEQHKIDQILNAWAKSQHTEWMNRHAGEGWSYGVRINMQNKTHPWMQPWESLPTQARELNIRAVRQLLDILDQFGYCITQKPQA